MCRSMVDIQSATAEIRRGIKKEEDRRKKPQGKNIMSASDTQGSHNNYECNMHIQKFNHTKKLFNSDFLQPID